MRSCSVTIQMKGTEQYFPVVLFIMLYEVVLTFESLDKIQNWDHSRESYWAVFSCGTVYCASFDSSQNQYKDFFLFMPYLFHIQVSHYTFAICSYREKQAEPTEMMELQGYTVDYCEAINGTQSKST